MVPANFSAKEVAKARAFLIQKLGTCRISTVTGKLLGNPYVTYQEVARHMGYEIESEFDGDHVGTLLGMVSEMEHPLTGILISAIVVRQEDKKVGKGFFHLVQHFNKLKSGSVNSDGIDEIACWNNEVRASVQKYGA